MYKKSSHNQQGRAERIAVIGHTNEYGVDPSAFHDSQNAYDIRRMDLVGEKRQNEERIRSLNVQIAHSTAAHKNGLNGAIGYAMFQSLHAEKEKACHRLYEIDRELAALKLKQTQEVRQQI